MPLLTTRYSLPDVHAALLSKKDWAPFPRHENRDVWLKLFYDHPINQRRAAYLLGRAESLAAVPFPTLTATDYMRFIRTGDRALFESPYFQRRNILGTFVLAECFNGQKRFLDNIINAAWAITEEATWCLPAHAARDELGALHTQSKHTVDLFAAETAMVLAETLYLIQSLLLPQAQALADRIRNLIVERIIHPFETQTYGWFDGHNNWTPWCASNIAGAAMYILDDPDRLAKIVHKCMTLCDAFIDKYADDGGCDEGPTYWSVAPGALLVFLELLHSRSQGKLSIYDAPKLQRMVAYITNAYLGHGRGLNFADAPPRINIRPYLLHRFADRVDMPVGQNHAGKELAGLAMRNYTENGPITTFITPEPNGAGLTARLRELFWLPPEPPAGVLRCNLTTWLPDLQVLIARQSPRPEQGITFAIKAGHNKENHNHNDLGHFVIYLDGHPAVVDIGVETYTQKTFSAQRYSIWCIRGSGHNAAVLKDPAFIQPDTEQAFGREFAAHSVRFLTPDPDTTGLTMRLEKAYPADSGLLAYTRTGTLHRGKNTVTLHDTLSFVNAPKIATWTFYTLQKPTLSPDHPNTLLIPAGPRTLQLTLPPNLLNPDIQPVPLHDTWLKSGWGDTLYKITLTAVSAPQTADYLFEFTGSAGVPPAPAQPPSPT